MANKENNLFTKLEHSLELLLKDGKRYLIILEELLEGYRNHSTEYKKLLNVMDIYSRYKTQLREDMEELREIYDMSDDTTDYTTDEGEEPVEGLEYVVIDVIDYVLREQAEQDRDFSNLFYRQNLLATIEVYILKMRHMGASYANYQLSVYKKLKPLLGAYCDRVLATLAWHSLCKSCLKKLKNEQSGIADKYKELEELVEHIQEKCVPFASLGEPSCTKRLEL